MVKSTKRVLPPNASLDVEKQKEFNQKIQIVKENTKTEPVQAGVVYLSHIPWGFEEKPIKDFFSQFGTITQLRVSRSKKTGNSKGYAYIQFAHDAVAKIVAETMNNYLMFGKLLKCKHLLNAHPNTFKNANRKFKKPMGQSRAIARHNQPKTPDAVLKSTKKALAKYKKKKNKLAALGIDYEVESLDQLSKVKEEIFSDDETVEKVKVKSKTSPKLTTPSKVLMKNTPKRQSIIPKTVDTPQGKLNVLVEDSSDDEIMFKTPPFSIKSSKLTDSGKPKLVTPKRKIEENVSSRTRGKKVKSSTPKQEGSKQTEAKSAKKTPKKAPPQKAKK